MDEITPSSRWAEIQAQSLERRAALLTAQSKTIAAQIEVTPALLELGIVLDRSFSMGATQLATLKAVNALLAEQRQLAAAATTLSLMLFNHCCETFMNSKPLDTAPELTPAEYRPDGDTALWDTALGE